MKNSLRYMILKEIKYLLESKVDFVIAAGRILETSAFKAAQRAILSGIIEGKALIKLEAGQIAEIEGLYRTIGLDTTNIFNRNREFVVSEAKKAVQRAVGGNIDDAAALAFLRNPESLVGALGKASFDAIMAEVLNVVTQAEVDKIARKFVQQNEQSFKTKTPIPQQKIIDFVIEEVKTSFPDLLRGVENLESVKTALKSPTDGVASLVRREDFVRSAGVRPYNAAVQWMQSNAPGIMRWVANLPIVPFATGFAVAAFIIYVVIRLLHDKIFGSDEGARTTTF